MTDCIFEKPSVKGKEIAPKNEDKSRYCTIPLITAVIFLLMSFEFKTGQAIIARIMLFGCVLSLWWLTVRFIASKKAFVRLDSDSITVCAPKYFSIYRQRIFRNKIEQFKITANPIQQYAGICNVSIRAKGIKKDKVPPFA